MFSSTVPVLFVLNYLAFPPVQTGPPHKGLPSLSRVRSAIGLLMKFYIDPRQIRPREMLKGALQKLEAEYPELSFSYRDKELFVKVGPYGKVLEIPEIFGTADLWFSLREIARFAVQKMRPPPRLSELETAILSGITAPLDKQTEFLPRAELLKLKLRERLKPDARVGIQFLLEKNYLKIVGILPDSPAFFSQLKVGDRISAVDGEPVSNEKGSDYWSKKLRGLRGSTVRLEVFRPGGGSRFSVALRRARVSPRAVEAQLLPERIGYLRIFVFNGEAYQMAKSALNILQQLAGGELAGLLLDLRKNPGGRVDIAVKIAGLFLNRKLIATLAGANISPKNYYSPAGQVVGEFPLAVLIDRYSASASEILAGALRAHRRAVIIGFRSFGKGTVQSVGLLPRSQLLYKITIAQYLIPPGNSLQTVGIEPDIKLLPLQIRDGHLQLIAPLIRDRRERLRRWPPFLRQNLDLLKISSKVVLSYPAGGFQPSLRLRRFLKIANRSELRADLPVWIARFLLSRVRTNRPEQMLREMARSVPKVRELLRRELRGLFERGAVSPRVDSKALKLSGLKKTSGKFLSFEAELKGCRLPAEIGQKCHLVLAVKNETSKPLPGLSAVLKSRISQLNFRELPFGTIPPGGKAVRRLEFSPRRDWPGGFDIISVELYSPLGERLLSERAIPFAWRARLFAPPPLRFELADPLPGGNGDGRLQWGEEVVLLGEVFGTSSLKVGKGELSIGVSIEELQRVFPPKEFPIPRPGESRSFRRVFTLPEKPVASRLKALSFTISLSPSTSGGSVQTFSFRQRVYPNSSRNLKKNLYNRASKEIYSFTPPKIAVEAGGGQWKALSTPILMAGEERSLKFKVSSKDGIRDIALFTNGKKVFYRAVDYLKRERVESLKFQLSPHLLSRSNRMELLVRTHRAPFRFGFYVGIVSQSGR